MAAVSTSYYPSAADVQRFWQSESAREESHVKVPDGFPLKLHSTLAWTQDEIKAKQDDWSLELTSEDLTAIEAALRAYEGESCILQPVNCVDQLIVLQSSVKQSLGYHRSQVCSSRLVISAPEAFVDPAV